MHSPEQQFDVLVKHLREMEADGSLVDNPHAVLIANKDEPEIIQRIRQKATKLLLDDGVPNSSRIQQLLAAGYRVCSEKEDLFGWQTGAIFTRKGRIVF